MVAVRNTLLLLLLREIGVAHAASLPVAELPPPPPGTSDNGTHSLVEKRDFTPRKYDHSSYFCLMRIRPSHYNFSGISLLVFKHSGCLLIHLHQCLEAIINFAQDWKVQLAITAATLRIAPFTWQGVARNCAEISEQEALGKKVLKAVWDCSIGAVAGILVMLMGGISGIAATAQAWGPLREWLHATFSNHKRSLEDMDLHARDALPHLSTLLGVDVRHLGHWNDTVTSRALRKRDDGDLGLEIRPVFGAKIFNRDFHFSIIDRSDEDDTLTWRFVSERGKREAVRSRREPRAIGSKTAVSTISP